MVAQGINLSTGVKLFDRYCLFNFQTSLGLIQYSQTETPHIHTSFLEIQYLHPISNISHFTFHISPWNYLKILYLIFNISNVFTLGKFYLHVVYYKIQCILQLQQWILILLAPIPSFKFLLITLRFLFTFSLH